MRNGFAILIPFMLSLTLNINLTASLSPQCGPFLPDDGRLVKVKDKDNVRHTAQIVVISDDGTQEIEMPCKYVPHLERDMPLTRKLGIEVIPVIRSEEYSSPRASGGSNFSHVLRKKSYVIIPATFRTNRETANDVEDFISYFFDSTHSSEFPISPIPNTLEMEETEYYGVMHDEDIARLDKFFNECEKQISSGYKLDDNILVLCRIFSENGGRYTPTKADGHYFGVYEVPMEGYKAFCKLRDLKGKASWSKPKGAWGAPAVLFESGGVSRIVDESELETDPMDPNCYWLRSGDISHCEFSIL